MYVLVCRVMTVTRVLLFKPPASAARYRTATNHMTRCWRRLSSRCPEHPPWHPWTEKHKKNCQQKALCQRTQTRWNSSEIGVWVQKGPCELAKRLAEDNLRGWLQCWFGNLLRTSTTKPKGVEGHYTKMIGSQATT